MSNVKWRALDALFRKSSSLSIFDKLELFHIMIRMMLGANDFDPLIPTDFSA